MNMNIIEEARDKIDHAASVVALKLATHRFLTQSEAIKIRLREKMLKLSIESKQDAIYDNLVSIHDEVEVNHDIIYNMPHIDVDSEKAKDDCEKLVSRQEWLENKFNMAYVDLATDPQVLAENEALQEEIKARDAELANKLIEDTKEQLKENADNVNVLVNNAVESVKNSFPSPKPTM